MQYMKLNNGSVYAGGEADFDIIPLLNNKLMYSENSKIQLKKFELP